MSAWPLLPGVPAMGHVARGVWHPGKVEGCPKCQRAEVGRHRAPESLAEHHERWASGEVTHEGEENDA